MSSIYLDHNATTPLLPEVGEAMAEACAAVFANPASQHQAGRRARQALEDARERIARIIGVDLTSRQPDRLIFTSGGTEANNLAVLGLAAAAERDAVAKLGDANQAPEAIVSAIEHQSVLGPAAELERKGWRIWRLPVMHSGVVDPVELSANINANTRFAAAMLGNNETGAVQPIAELAKICNAAGVPLHCDAVQTVGKVHVNFRELGVASMSVAAHKFHGPVGIGALAVRHDVAIEPLIWGGSQQGGSRPGTEAIVPAIGFCRALEIFESESAHRTQRLAMLRDRFEAGLRAGYPQLVINAAGAVRLPHTSNVAFVGLERQALLMALDLAGVACSGGSACASGSSEPSPVLIATGCPSEVIGSSLRFSFGATTTAAEIDEALRRILAVCEKLTTIARGRRVSTHR